MLAVSAVVCTALLTRDARRLGIPSQLVVDCVFFVAVGGILGARLYFVLLNLGYFIKYPLEMVMIQNGGLAWQGGLVAGSLMAWWFIKKRKLPLLTTLDLLAPYAALGQAIGRIGCFLNGCCFGKPVAWGIYFPVHEAHLYPTQLYCSFGLLVIFFILKKFQKSAKRPGEVFFVYLFLASSWRFIVEFFRADHEILYFGLSIYQVFCVIVIALSVYAYTRFKSRP